MSSQRIEIHESPVHGPLARGPAGAPPAVENAYSDFCDMMEVCTLLQDELGLRRVTHWTMLRKFSQRADTRRVGRLLLGLLKEVRVRVLYMTADSTGFSSMSTSTYYTRVL